MILTLKIIWLLILKIILPLLIISLTIIYIKDDINTPNNIIIDIKANFTTPSIKLLMQW